MSADVLDFAGLEEAASAATADTNVETSSTNDSTVDSGTTQDTGSDTSGDSTSVDSSSSTSDTTNKSDVTTSTQKEEDLPGTPQTPVEVRKALKAFRDANPKANASLVKLLHGSYERWEAAKEHFPSVQAMEEAKAFIDLVGGQEGYEKLQTLVNSVNDSDRLLYEGGQSHVDLVNNIYDDMKSEGKTSQFTELASPLLSKIKEVDPKGYYQMFSPFHVAALEQANLPQVLKDLSDAIAKGDEGSIKNAKSIVEDIQSWFNELKGTVAKQKATATDPDRQKLQEERNAFLKEKEEFSTKQTKEFQTNVGKDAETISAKALGTHLGNLRKTPYFKAFKTENLRPLANTILYNLRQELEKDKAYQTQMKALWGEKSPNKDKILNYHKTKVESISDRIVRETANSMYPDHAKGGSAAGRIAAKNDKVEAQKQVDDAAASAGQPQYVPVKPKNLNRQMDPKGYLEVAGKGYIPNGKGGWRFITWRKPMA